MNHVIFGGSGFLGRRLVSDLGSRGESVIIVDIASPEGGSDEKVTFVRADITDAEELSKVPLSSGDVVHHLATKLIVPNFPRKNRDEYFWSCIYEGTLNVLNLLVSRGCCNLVYWSTDMVYGPALYTPRKEDHPRRPFGPYGIAKVAAEDLCMAHREKSLNITIFRPRLIMGPGRRGIFERLFKLIDWNLPVPLIGSGQNHFQFVSVADCAAASIMAVEAGFPNAEYNLGSADPPTVRELLRGLVDRVGSKSILMQTPGGLVKATLATFNAIGVGLMDPEQFQIADQDVVLDIARAEQDLGWVPRDSDTDMLISAYDSYVNGGTIR